MRKIAIAFACLLACLCSLPACGDEDDPAPEEAAPADPDAATPDAAADGGPDAGSDLQFHAGVYAGDRYNLTGAARRED